jgi:3-isopropylmalate/(R)-2-methylmalate dehydratase large subunit
MNVTEKIIAKKAGKKSVKPGDLVWADIDVLMTHDPCSPGVISIFKENFGKTAKVWDNERHIMIPDHFIFTADKKSNANVQIMREFAKEQNTKYFYDVGTPNYKGVCHIALAEGGHNLPGELLLGTDSHTVTSGAFGTLGIGVGNTDAAFALGTGKILLKVPETIKIVLNGSLPQYVKAKDVILKIVGDLTMNGATYCAIEFAGDYIDTLGVEDRMTICNMVIECGAKNGIMVPNQAVLDYLEDKSYRPFEIVEPDADATYLKVIEYDVSTFEPYIAKPHSPDNLDIISNVKGIEIDQAYIGSCTGGKLSDFVMVADYLQGKKVKIKTYAVPATQDVADGLNTSFVRGESVYSILKNAGVSVSLQASCAACLGGPKDTFGRVQDEINVISTTNRNFRGRMGNKNANIYLASPIITIATAIEGKIAVPEVHQKQPTDF